MPPEPDNETWLLDACTDDILTRRSAEEHLTPIEVLIHSMWVADYGMRNAGDLETAADLHPHFQAEGARAATEAGLVRSAKALLLPTADLEHRYFDLFDAVVDEIREAAEAAATAEAAAAETAGAAKASQ